MTRRASRWARAVWLLGLLLAACGPSPSPAREASSPAERAALDAAPTGSPLPLELRTPADGAVVPWSFPSLSFRWSEGFQADLFRLRVVGAEGRVLVEVVTTAREQTVAPSAWGPVRAAVGEGGVFDVEVVAASLGPDGRLRRGPTAARARVRFSGPGEHPTGRVIYPRWFRTPGAPPGPMPYNRALAVPLREAMDGSVERLAERWFAGDPYRIGPSIPGWEPPPPEARASRSYDYSAVAVNPIHPAYHEFYPLPEVEAPSIEVCPVFSPISTFQALPRVFAEDGFRVVREGDPAVVYESAGGSMPRFHPRRPEVLVFADRSNEVGNDTMQSFYHSDLRSIELGVGDARDVPGASAPDRCEFFPEWSADGRSLVFSRAPAGEPCDGRRGRLELVRVAFDGDAALAPEVLVPVSPEWGSSFAPRCSPDGRWIVFVRAKRGFLFSGDTDLWIVATEGGTPRRLMISTDALEGWPAFSPDGRWLAFSSNRDRVEQARGYVVRFFDDGRVAPVVPLPGAGASDASIVGLDWGP
jgi:hypothetical protein